MTTKVFTFGALALAFALAFAAAASCSSSPAGSQNDGAVSPDAAFSCPLAIAELCAQGDPPAGQFGVHCAATLAAAEQDPAVCMTPMVSEATCGTFTVITVTNVDFSYLYYYDASGNLVAVTSDGLIAQQCVAGPATFAPPHATCTDRRPLPACAADGGTTD
jgi:YD repeat-containing protein